MWAALLANAALAEKGSKVRPGFIAILKQMAPDEAELLKIISDMTDEKMALQKAVGNRPSRRAVSLARLLFASDFQAILFEQFPRSDEEDQAVISRCRICMQALRNSGLVVNMDGVILLGPFGRAFLECCEPPKPADSPVS
jgi:hypothetical protein